MCADDEADSEATGEDWLLTNAVLASQLAKGLRLTQAEWDACGISNLRSDHYIKVGDDYFRPAKPLTEQLADFASLTLMSQVGNALVCSECLGDGTAQLCLDGKCKRCSFQRPSLVRGFATKDR